MSNGGALTAPRAGAGAGVRRQFGRVEGGVSLGLETLWHHGEGPAAIAGSQQTVSTRLFVLAAPLLLRLRLPFAGRWGAAIEGGPVPAFAATSAQSNASGVETFRNIVFGGRARATLDFTAGRSRILVGATVGTAKLADGPLRGDIEGRSLFVGYETWWLDLSP
jgi:hypothetical protein